LPLAKYVGENMVTDEELAQKVKLAPSREWANSYFDLVKEILDVTKISEDNPRLLMSLRQKDRRYFPITINSRYVIVSDTQDVGLIFTPNYREIPELRKKDNFEFKNRNPDIEPPCFLWFDSLDEIVSLLNSSKKVRQCWHDALIAEVNNAKLSRFRQHHQPKIYKLVADKIFRAKILDMAFPESKPIEQLDDYVQYHNSEETGVSCLELNSFGISTSKPVSKLKGNRIWLIGGIGKPRRYYLCYYFLVDTVEATDGDFKFMVNGQKGTLLKPPILLNGFSWFKNFLKKQQNFSFGLRKIDKVFVSKLEKIISGQKEQSLSDNEAQNNGGGFGNSENNQEVEQAAIKFVSDDYKKHGWMVKSVESEKRGFDLLCTKAKKQEHVEVKGIQGNFVSFIITAGEVKQSQSDKYFILCAVTSALSNPKPHRFTAKEFQEKFALETISYRAFQK